MPCVDWDAIRGKSSLDPNAYKPKISDFTSAEELYEYMEKQKKESGPRMATEFNIDHPPLKALPFIEFPKMMYRTPANRTQPDITLIANNEEDEHAAKGNGYIEKPHAPELRCESGKEYAGHELRCEWHVGHVDEGKKHRNGNRVWTDELLDMDSGSIVSGAEAGHEVEHTRRGPGRPRQQQ
jgi:hypothetical protein